MQSLSLRSESVPNTHTQQLRSRYVPRPKVATQSPFSVDSIARHLQLWEEIPPPPPPRLNPGLQYFKSVIYKDNTIEGSHLMREHIAAVEAAHSAAMLAQNVHREHRELIDMADTDVSSSSFNHQEKILAATALERNLQEQKTKYLAWSTHQNRLFRDYDGLQNVVAHHAKVRRVCLHCDPMVGLWEVQRLGSSGVFSVGRYRMLGAHASFVFHEVPSRSWCHVPLEREITTKKHVPATSVTSTIRGNTVRGCLDPVPTDVVADNHTGAIKSPVQPPQLVWSDGMLWLKICTVHLYATMPVQSSQLALTSSIKPNRQLTVARETSRAISKHLKSMEGSQGAAVCIHGICNSMRQNRSADVQIAGCLALTKAVTTGTMTNIGNHGGFREMVERIAAAMATHPANPSVLYAAMPLAYSILEATTDQTVATERLA
ncbi:hypothetical protein AaE_005509 [Aphanomyces astaci]|uniref:Uncharacterized protein n=1 Tax=Aphanomyces astaci TaxID=112090 RepID=A0A6A5A7P7_APHAT|nr:hypothetical protein AaE_005509 [Aphanomyces astaci]